MKVGSNTASDLKIAYIGGGSKGWAWNFMSDLSEEKKLSGEVFLYDIDHDAAKANEIIGNRINEKFPDCAKWKYKYSPSLEDALKGADFIIISILPGTFDEMEYDVTLPTEYGIKQPVGDTTGVGGVMRALRTVPMYKEIALAIKEFAPDSYVINYTNPMTVCVKTLYTVFPQIKAVGCCHEVFGTQKILAKVLKEYKGIDAHHLDINIEVGGINHFTWITKAYYQNIDLLPYYCDFVKKHKDAGFANGKDENHFNFVFDSAQMVKFDLFDRFGAIAAAGDRHLAEFCPKNWYLKNDEQTASFKFGYTPVKWRKENEIARKEKAERLLNGEEEFKLKSSGEVGVRMIKALCGIDSFKTNVNLINYGQFPQAPMNAVVETNALLSGVGIEPIVSLTPLPEAVYAMISRIINLQEMIVKAALCYDLELAFQAFVLDPLNNLELNKSRELFNKMLEGTRNYLPDEYFSNGKRRHHA